MAIKILSTIIIISEVVSPEKTVDLLDETRAMIYLMRYGYVDPNKWSNSLVTEDQYRSELQRRFFFDFWGGPLLLDP